MSYPAIILSLLATFTIGQVTTSAVQPSPISVTSSFCDPGQSSPNGTACNGSVGNPISTSLPASTTSSSSLIDRNATYIHNATRSHGLVVTLATLIRPTASTTPYLSVLDRNGTYVGGGIRVRNRTDTQMGGISDDQTSTPTMSDNPTETTMDTMITMGLNKRASTKAGVEDCPLALTDSMFEFPHLIVWSQKGQNTSTTQYNGKVNAQTTSYFTFDIPTNYSGRTCEVVFSLPRQDQLETSSYTFKGSGSLVFSSLRSPAMENANVPTVSVRLNSWVPVPGNKFAVVSGPCAAGQQIGYSMVGTGNLTMDYFQDYNHCPIGLWIVAY